MKSYFLLKIIVVLLISFSFTRFSYSQAGWTALTSNTTNNLTGVCFVNSSTGFAIGENSTILKTTNEGLNWSIISSPVVATFKDIHFANVNTGYISGLNGVIIKTTDIGQSWSIISTDATNWNAIFFIADTGWVAGTTGKIKKTTNGGNNWVAQNANCSSTYQFDGMYFLNSATGYTCGGQHLPWPSNRIIDKTTNGGVNWVPNATTQVSAFVKIQMINSSTGWTVGYTPGDSGCVSKTTDGGGVWSYRTIISPNIRINSLLFFDSWMGYIVGNNGTIMKTYTGLTTPGFSAETSNTTNNLLDIEYSGNALYAVGSSGTILKKNYSYIISVTSGSWSNPSTWSTGTVPGQNDEVGIQPGHTVTVDNANCSCNYLCINGNLNINSNSTLNIYRNLVNYGNIDGSADFGQLQFCGSAAQTFINSGTVTSPISIFTVNNPSGLTIDGTSNIFTALNINLYCGVLTNNKKLSIGICGTTPAMIQRGASGSSNTAGSLNDSLYSFGIGSGGLNILYVSSSTTISTGYEIPTSGNVNYIYAGYSTTLSKNVTISDSLNLAAGSFSKGAKTLTLGNNCTIIRSGGSLASAPVYSANVNIAYTGSNAITIANEMPVWPTSTILQNLTNSNTNSVTINRNVTVSGTLTLNSGQISNCTFLTLANNATISRTNGNLSCPPFFGSNVNVIYTGSNSITTGNEMPTTPSILMNLTNNNSNTVTLNSDVTVNGTLTLSSGNINTDSHIITLGSSTSNLGDLSYTSGIIITGSTGGFKRWFAPSTVSNVIFPVGTADNFNKIILSYTIAPSTGGTLTAKFIPSDPGTNSPNPINDNGYMVDAYSPTGYWQIDNSGITGGIYTLGLEGQGFNIGGNSILNYQLLRLMKRPASGYDWQTLGAHVNGTGTNDDPTAFRSGLTEFSQFAFGGNSIDNPFTGPLPVELTKFTNSIKERDVFLSWTTTNEQNNSGFQIERMNENVNNIWNNVGFVKGKNNSSKNNYQYTDTKLSSGKYKYRLKQVDNNGNYKYYELNNTIEIGLPMKYSLSQNYPNPFNPSTKFDFTLPENSKVRIELYNIQGKRVLSITNEYFRAGYYTKEITGNNLASGVYFLIMSANSISKEYFLNKKLLLIK